MDKRIKQSYIESYRKIYQNNSIIYSGTTTNANNKAKTI